MSARLTLIAAVAKNGVIGNSNALPWHLPEDLRHFKALTSGHAVIMGRKTWESLPARFRPLPGRRNIVVTRDPGYAAEGATVVHSLQEAIQVGAGPSQADAGSPPLGVGGSEPLLRAWGDNIVGVTEGNPFFGTGGTECPAAGENLGSQHREHSGHGATAQAHKTQAQPTGDMLLFRNAWFFLRDHRVLRGELLFPG